MNQRPEGVASSLDAVSLGPTFDMTVLGEESAAVFRKEFRDHVIEGLSKPNKRLSSMYFYDDRGSDLFAKITETEDYYLTRSEKELFETHANDIVKSHFCNTGVFDQNETINVVELGAGDGRKTTVLLQALLAHGVKFDYVPIDISLKAMTNLFETMGRLMRNESFNIHGVVGDYVEGLEHVVSMYPSRRTAVLFIGSSIGNSPPDTAISFLTTLRTKLQPRDILVLGTDLRKETGTMIRAYSDSEGVTRQFNLNLLERMNRELGTNFNPDNFEHLAIYNPELGAMESYLLATKPHIVEMSSENAPPDKINSAAAHKFAFDSFEGLHLESSFKYTTGIISHFLKSSGFGSHSEYFDKRHWFMESVSVVPDI